MVKNPNAIIIQETQVPSLAQEDPLEKEMAHSSILAQEIPMDLRAWRVTVVAHVYTHTHTHTHTHTVAKSQT